MVYASRARTSVWFERYRAIDIQMPLHQVIANSLDEARIHLATQLNAEDVKTEVRRLNDKGEVVASYRKVEAKDLVGVCNVG